MRFAITGSTGMIGLALTKYLIENNHEVIMLIRRNSKKKDLIIKNEKIQIIECDLNEIEALDVENKCDYFIHLGWASTIGEGRNDVYLQNLNVKYTLDAVKLAKRWNAKKFIGVGSQAEYGLKEEKLSIDTPCNPITGYGIAKYSAGKLAKILAEQNALEFNWVRILSVYGDNDNPNTLMSYAKKCFIDGVSPDVTPCEQIWDYISVDELVKILYKIILNGKNGISYPLGSGVGKPLKDHLISLRDSINPNIKINFGAKPYPKNQVMYLVADMSYLKELEEK